ncbi:MAG: M20/M25/M40 family metallo-hydrolase [Bryobacteraceae bacterium]|nr:M20/M25/M40 family metallo-hydrolase [Bryobacteraceae bacterium]MDW8380392.1 M20/M25/M40 family metallo-hydrolase [Bryobacterales bacterium]
MNHTLDSANKQAYAKPEARFEQRAAELAESSALRECQRWFYRNKLWVNEQHLQLCRIPSPTFLEHERAEWMAEQFDSLGWEAKPDRAGNIIAYANGRREGPFVAVTAHLDTVLAPRNPHEIRVAPDGRFYGPGVSDNGAGLAALLALAAVWKTAQPVKERCGPSLVLVANVGEEGEGNLNGMRYLCKSSPLGGRIRSYVVLDGPSTDHITCRALASRRFELVVSGPGGHSWSDHGNGNAVHALSRVIHYFTESLQSEPQASTKSSFNFGVIEGGLSVNSIPASARTKLDIRAEDPQKLDELARCFGLAVERAIEVENARSTGGKVQARIREIGFRPGGSLSETSELLPSLRAVDSYLGIRAHLDCASTDANIPLSMGLEAVSIGAGGQGGGAHTEAEWFDPDGRELGLQRILLAVCMLLTA